jgi:hypothetical protein
LFYDEADFLDPCGPILYLQYLLNMVKIYFTIHANLALFGCVSDVVNNFGTVHQSARVQEGSKIGTIEVKIKLLSI